MRSARRAVTVVALAALALLVPGAAQAKSYSLPKAVVHVEIASDGSLLVREDITFSYSGSFSGAYRDIPVRGGERVDLVRVSEGGEAYRPGGNTVLGSFDLPGEYGVDENTQRVRVVWHYRALNEQRTFTIRYRFRGLAVAYDDVVDVNLQVWGDEWPVAVSDLRAEMELPRPIGLTGTRYRVWGAPEWVRGVVDRTRTGTTLRAVNVPSGQFVEMRTVFPRRLLTSTRGARVVDGNGFAGIVAEQGERADEYAEGREKIDEAKDNLGRTMLTLAAFALLPALGVMLAIWLLFGRERGTGYDREYEQEPPSDEAPAIVPPLLRQGTEPGSLEFTATLFDLVRRGYYVAKPVTTEKKTWAGLRTEQVADLELSPGDSSVELTEFEEPVAKVFDHIVDDGPEVLSKMRDRIESTRASNAKRFERFKENVSDEIKKRRWYLGTGAKVFAVAIVASVAAAVVLLWMGIAGFRPEAPRWNEVVQIALGVCAIVNAVVLIIGVANTKLWRRRTKAGQLEAQRWEAFRRYLADFPRLDIAPPATLALWERFLVYGIAFGIAERVLQGAQIHMPEELAEASSIYWISPHGDLGSGASALAIGDLSSGFGSALAPPSSSGSGGSGGGFSGGGGRGRRRRRRRSLVAQPRRRLVLVERDRAGDRDVERLGALGHRDRRGTRRTSSTSAGSPSRSAPSTNVTRSGARPRQAAGPLADERDSRRGRVLEASSGTRKIAPVEPRSAFGAVGIGASLTTERRTRPSASAARISVPTFPGRPTCQSASPTGAGSPWRESSRRKTRDHARRMRELRDVGEQLRLDARSPARRERRPARARRRAPPRRGPRPRRRRGRAAALARPQPPDELEPRVRRRGDHARPDAQRGLRLPRSP